MAFLQTVWDYLRTAKDYRHTRRCLHNLDDRLLADIGLRRDQIDTLAHELYEVERKKTALEAENRKNEKSSRSGSFDGHGLAPQH